MKIPLVLQWFWTISWNITTPIIILVVLIKTWVAFEPEHFLDYEYQPAVQFLGWLLELYPVGIVVVIGTWNVWKKNREGEPVAFFSVGPMLKPKTTWGPRKDRGETAPNSDEQANHPEEDGGAHKVEHNGGVDNPAYSE